jgi:lipoate---protein ligase
VSERAGAAWPLVRESGPAQRLHTASATSVGDSPLAGRSVRWLEVERPALVLGSTQPDSDVDLGAAAAAGIDIARRRSGGGAVLVEPAGLVWVDVIVPVGDPLWDADIGRAAWWVGSAWAAAIEGVGVGPATVWRDALRSSRWSKQVCFAGVGPGEVLVGPKKVAGVSQRRTRYGALFQTAALLTWDPSCVLGLLRLDAAERAAASQELAPLAMGVGPDRRSDLLAGFLAALPA